MQMTDWQPVATIPVGVRVEVKTYTGIICEARVSGRPGDRLYIRRATPQYRKARVAALRPDGRGDVSVVAWRPLDKGA